jgi:hypothetical protein
LLIEGIAPDIVLPYAKPYTKYKNTGKIGEGAFGLVFKGISLSQEGTEIAIKKFKTGNNLMSYDAFKEFQYEATISQGNTIYPSSLNP